MRGDDGLGPQLVDILYDKLLRVTYKDTDGVFLLNAGTAPENHTVEIRNIEPSHVIIVDAVEFDSEPGSIHIIDKEQIDNFNLSTHTMPISFLIKYIEDSTNAKVLTVGIQPKEMTLINVISDEVKKSIEELSDYLVKIV